MKIMGVADDISRFGAFGFLFSVYPNALVCSVVSSGELLPDVWGDGYTVCVAV